MCIYMCGVWGGGILVRRNLFFCLGSYVLGEKWGYKLKRENVR